AKAAAVPYADLGDPQSLNLYAYVRNRPTAMVDTDGHDSKVEGDVLCTTTGDNCTNTITNTRGDVIDNQRIVVVQQETVTRTYDDVTQERTVTTTTTTAIFSAQEGHEGDFVRGTTRTVKDDYDPANNKGTETDSG